MRQKNIGWRLDSILAGELIALRVAPCSVLAGFGPSPHFSQAFYSGGVSRHVSCVALGRIPRRTVEYACGILPSRWPKRQMRLVSMPVYPASLRNPVRNAG
jgi:hypothetical protein